MCTKSMDFVCAFVGAAVNGVMPICIGYKKEVM